MYLHVHVLSLVLPFGSSSSVSGSHLAHPGEELGESMGGPPGVERHEPYAHGAAGVGDLRNPHILAARASFVYHGGHCPVTTVTLVARIADTLGAACSESPRCGALTQCGGTGYPGGAWPRCTRERDGRFPLVALRLPEVG